MHFAVPLARADRIQTGIQSLIFMNGQDCSFVYQFGYIREYIYCGLIWKLFDVLISGFSIRNIEKLTDISILCIHEKDMGTFSPEFAQVRMLFFHTYRIHFIY